MLLDLTTTYYCAWCISCIPMVWKGLKVDQTTSQQSQSDCMHAWHAGVCCWFLPQVFLTAQYLGIAMEFASGGDMFEYVVKKNGLREEEARWFFQQLIVGLDYCHRMVRWHGRGVGAARAPAALCLNSSRRLAATQRSSGVIDMDSSRSSQAVALSAC